MTRVNGPAARSKYDHPIKRRSGSLSMDHPEPRIISRNPSQADFDRKLASQVKGSLRKLVPGSARHVIVEAKEGTVTLRGDVPSFHIRQVFVHCCRRVPGVVGVVDELNVQA
jgi:osmotically-inducible protein OsmY